MVKIGKSAGAIFVTSFFAGLTVAFAGYSLTGKIVGAPALILAIWASLGHFVTLDDDMPGAWSNPEGSKKIWYGSILELFAKIAVLLCVVFSIYV